MNKRLLLGLLAAAAVPTAIWADQSINVTASIEKSCKFNSLGAFDPSPTVTSGTLSVGASTAAINNPTNASGYMQNWGFLFKINATCNHVSNLDLTTVNGGLKTTGSASGFVSRFDYSAQVSFDGTGSALLLPTNGSPGASTIGAPHPTTTPHTGEVTLQVTGVPDVTYPVMAGFYTDTLIITLSPQ